MNNHYKNQRIRRLACKTYLSNKDFSYLTKEYFNIYQTFLNNDIIFYDNAFLRIFLQYYKNKNTYLYHYIESLNFRSDKLMIDFIKDIIEIKKLDILMDNQNNLDKIEMIYKDICYNLDNDYNIQPEEKEIHEKIYRDLLKENIPDESVMYFADKLEFFQNGFDIYFILEYLKDKMSISQNLSILYNNARNLNYNYFEREIVNFLPRRVGDDWGWQERLSERKNHLIQLCNKLPLTKYDSDEFNDLLKKYMQKIKSSSPVQAGRKVIIDEYLMLQSNYTKKSIGKRFFCTYLQPASFLDQGKYKDIHVVRDIKNSAIYYLVDGKSIQLCLLDFMCTYEDYLELLK